MNHYLRLFLCSLGMTFVLLLLFMGYLLVTRSWLRQYMGLDTEAMAVSVILGVSSIAWLPVRSGLRWGMGVLYVPVAAFLLFYCAVMFVCARYGACL